MLREEIVAEVIRILHGPMGGPGEELNKSPLDFYSTGVLFPQLPLTIEFEDQDDSSPGTAPEDEAPIEVAVDSESVAMKKRRAAQESDEPDSSGELELTTKFRPSAAGVSVLVTVDSVLLITIRFATYKKRTTEKAVEGSDGAKTSKLSYFKHFPYEFMFKFIDGRFEANGISYKQESNMIFVDLQEDAQLIITTRPYPNQKSGQDLLIRTCTLINKREAKAFSQQKNAEDCLFQPEIIIEAPEGFYSFDDRTDLNVLSEEDLNLKLLYRNYKTYAQGHGISVNWSAEDDQVQKVFTQVLPKENVNGVDLNPEIFRESNVLFIKRLSGAALDKSYSWPSIHNEYRAFANLYKVWIAEEEKLVDVVLNDEQLRKKARSNLQQCMMLFSRMSAGIQILAEDPDARKAFEDANRAMFMQRVMADFSRHRRTAGRVQHDDNNFDDALPNYTRIPYDAGAGKIWKDGQLHIDTIHYERSGTLARWRPFQLAFLLSQIAGITNPNSDDRDTVDLIWFPTGGGKTEAYLGLTAFTIFFRRLKAKRSFNNPDQGAGVSVLMRYTLRLLNKQQFERATILICACDIIRRLEPAAYGNSRISNGIWMGRSMTPNSVNDQVKDYADYIKQINRVRQPSTFKNSPPLLSCPCCGNRLVREIENNKVAGRWGYFRAKNLRNTETGRYLIGCTNTKCEFHVTAATYQHRKDYILPVYEVDETIYLERPSLLFSTVDKFVQLAWKSEAFNLFNIELGNHQVRRLYPSPELIIQDELHLISSALGTIYGVYEIAVDRLCREAGGVIAKVVGATATVRNAADQCKRLYGRKHFLQFPPPATDADNSFYARKIKGIDPKNRLYVGFMPSGVTTSTALIRLAAVLLERIPAMACSNEELDSYYTLIVYFNALKELGKFRTFLTDDIVAYRKLLANHFATFNKPFNHNSLCELSSVMTADEITKGLDRLEKTTLPRGLDKNNILIKNLFEAGIRTLSDLKTAKGGSIWNRFLNPDYFKQLGLTYSGDNSKDYQIFLNEANRLIPSQPEPVQIAPATNMISVGVDIPRLNTMIVNGQPKTTAEYIQASSRVGREGPGVVFTFLAPTKNRDRSHYEQFKAFHQAYYYYVEASSVTPFSQPALEKVLPTVLIALTRSLFLKGSLGVFDPLNSHYKAFIEGVINDVKAKAAAIYSEDADEICRTIDAIQQEFTDKISRLTGDRRLAQYTDFMRFDPTLEQIVTEIKNPKAYYNAPAQFVDILLQDHIPTMQTLRNVEASSRIRIKSSQI